MKIAITGHKKGIGQAFAKQLEQRGHTIVGISRSEGENIRRVKHTAGLIESCDLFINNAGRTKFSLFLSDACRQCPLAPAGWTSSM